MNTKALFSSAAEFLALAQGEKPGTSKSENPTMPIPSTSNAEIVGVPSSRPQSEVHALKKENRELRLYLSMILHDPYVSEYPVADIKRLVEKKLNER